MSAIFYGNKPLNSLTISVLGSKRSLLPGAKAGHRHRNWTKTSPGFHALFSSFSYSRIVMRAAFVVRLGRDTKPAQNYFEGWVEEVDSGNELRFHSTTELLRFLGQRFHAVFGSEPKELEEPPHVSSVGEED